MNYNIRFDFMRHRKTFFLISIVISVLGALSLGIFGFNLGIDFQSGTSLDISVGKTLTTEDIQPIFADAGTDPILTIGGENNEKVNARFKEALAPDVRNQIVSAFQEKYGQDNVHVEEYTVDAEMAREFGRNTVIYVALASLLIMVYIIIRFEWRFAVAGIIALFHDAFIVISIFSIFRLEVNLPFVAAVLTIIGYSINDTIIIFDRIRENLKFTKLKTFEDLSQLVNTSIWQTMTRSINTGVTVLFVTIALFIFGSEAIRLFSLAMLIGLISGVYSSICLASPLWAVMKQRTKKQPKPATAA